MYIGCDTLKKLYKLDVEKDFTTSSKLITFLNPEYSCVISNKYDDVIAGRAILKNFLFDQRDFYSFSSISGNIAGFVDIFENGISKKAVFIKNDFREKMVNTSKFEINNLKQFEFFLKGTSFYDLFIFEKNLTFLVNGINDEPYVSIEGFILKNFSDLLVETISILDELFSFKKSLIVFKNVENDNISEFLSITGSYTNMNILGLEDKYLIGNNDILLEKLNLTSDKCIIIKPSVLLEISYFLKNRCIKSNKYITVVDEELKKIFFVNCKKNILLSEVINKLGLYNNDAEFFKNGLLSGVKININKEILTDSIDAIIVCKPKLIEVSKCIRCGKCVNVCPVNLNPCKMAVEKKYDKTCINCGLCSYFCPSNVEFYKGYPSE